MSEIVNLSLGLFYYRPDYKFNQIVIFPEINPGKSLLPTGLAVHTSTIEWRKYAVSDVGCGMRLVQSFINKEQFDKQNWDNIGIKIKSNKGKLGDLGGGNHFLVALISENNPYIHFLIHTGSRDESSMVDNLTNNAVLFDKEYKKILVWAEDNRIEIQKVIEKYFGKTKLIVDKAHNSYQKLSDNSVIIRKGTVQIEPDEITVIPSHLLDKVILVKANEKVNEILNSLSHGTGRRMSRGQAKEASVEYEKSGGFTGLREKVYIPPFISNASLNTEGPFAYNDIDTTLDKLNKYFTLIDEFKIIAYLGHL